jgi:group I intron endonuclease
MPYGYIYVVRNSVDDKVYVGQTVMEPKERFRIHCKPSNRRYSLLSEAICEFGRDKFWIEVLATVNSQKELNETEVLFISQLNSIYPNGYNKRDGGYQFGRMHPETKEKIARANRGQRRSKATLERMSKASRGNQHARGKRRKGPHPATPKTPEHAANIAKAIKEWHQNAPRKERPCDVCGDMFKYIRKDARYCPKHRGYRRKAV